MLAIGTVARETGIKIPTIRFYEQEGLIKAPPRTESGRRLYSDDDVRRLSFIRHARDLGFELDDVRSLLDLSDQPDRTCADVDQIARLHLDEVEARIERLRALKRELTRIVSSCAGGKTAECRIIEALADHEHCAAPHPAPAKVVKRRKSPKSSKKHRM